MGKAPRGLLTRERESSKPKTRAPVPERLAIGRFGVRPEIPAREMDSTQAVADTRENAKRRDVTLAGVCC
jgi:hypothetical protein